MTWTAWSPLRKPWAAAMVRYGVQEQHYGPVASALFMTLKQELGDDFTPEVKCAWTETYLLLAGVMKDAGAKANKAA